MIDIMRSWINICEMWDTCETSVKHEEHLWKKNATEGKTNTQN